MASGFLNSLLAFCAAKARWVLVAGLLAGLGLPEIAIAAKPSVPWFIAALLFTASLRIGPQAAFGAVAQLKTHVWITLTMQVLVPLVVVLIAMALGMTGPFLLALVLVAAAAPISGSPNLVMMLGHDPAPALRQLVIGTAMLPVTVLPVFWLLPQLGDALVIMQAALRLLLIIGGASLLGFAIRHRWFKELSPQAVVNIDGISAILMALVVVGLMWALSDAFQNRPGLLLLTLLFAFAVNFGFQFAGMHFWGKFTAASYRTSLSVISGNRNVALYLTALPASVLDELYLFIGCYQFPMYLTPLLMQRFYRKPASSE